MAKEVTCSAPVNIAVIKYWGKRDSKLILPTNSSLSVTLDQADLRSVTTARLLDQDVNDCPDRLFLNGVEEVIQKDSRLGRCLQSIRQIKIKSEQCPSDLDSSSAEGLPESRRGILIASENNFPTAAGLASSASGFAALAFTLSNLYSLPISPSDLSKLARQGSGSACRSIFGGFVSWEMGQLTDGSDSFSIQVAPRSHWPELDALICVVSQSKKITSSTNGMDSSVQTSSLLQHRIRQVVPDRMNQIKRAILEKDFDTFAAITMADSNQFHAICLDTSPPIFYLNDLSRSIISVVEELNRSSRAQGLGYLAAYTFDAGPNAVIYAPRKNMKLIISLILNYFPLANSNRFEDSKKIFSDSESIHTLKGLPDTFNRNIISTCPEGSSITRLIHTQIGDGPEVLNNQIGGGLLTTDGHPQSLVIS